MFWRHKCAKTSGWSSFEFDNCDGCIMSALTAGALTVERCAQVRTTLRFLQSLPNDEGEWPAASPEDLAHVQELHQTSQSMLLGWTHDAFVEIADVLGLDKDSDKMKSVDKIVRRAVAKALSY